MANERELNKRIRSIGNISQVTSALAAVSAAKATKAQHQVIATRDYAGKAFEILINLASQPGVEGSNTHPLLTTRSEIKNSALIMVTGDRGLADPEPDPRPWEKIVDGDLSPRDMVTMLEEAMRAAAKELDFEKAAALRDRIEDLKMQWGIAATED